MKRCTKRRYKDRVAADLALATIRRTTRGHPMNENLYRIYRQNLRRNTTVKEYRRMHKLERVFFALPAKAYVRWHHLRHRFKNRRTPEGVLFNATKEDV